MEYHFRIVHRNCKQNVVADTLSRIKMPNDDSLNREAETLEAIQAKSALNTVKMVQTRSRTSTGKAIDVPSESPFYGGRAYIEENNGMMIETGEFDQIFCLFDDINCEMKRRLEHNLKKNIEIPLSFQTDELKRLDASRMIVKIHRFIKSEEQLYLKKNSLNSVRMNCMRTLLLTPISAMHKAILISRKPSMDLLASLT